jgi:hypothetical protein
MLKTIILLAFLSMVVFTSSIHSQEFKSIDLKATSTASISDSLVDLKQEPSNKILPSPKLFNLWWQIVQHQTRRKVCCRRKFGICYKWGTEICQNGRCEERC